MTKAYYAQIVNSEGQVLKAGYINDANGKFHTDDGGSCTGDEELIPTDIPPGAYLDSVLDIKGDTASDAIRGIAATIAQRFGWPVHERFLNHK